MCLTESSYSFYSFILIGPLYMYPSSGFFFIFIGYLYTFQLVEALISLLSVNCCCCFETPWCKMNDTTVCFILSTGQNRSHTPLP